MSDIEHVYFNEKPIRKLRFYEQVCLCCGSLLLNKFYEEYNLGITIVVNKEEFLDIPKETGEYWIETVPLEEEYYMHIKHRKNFIEEDDED